MPDGSVTYEGAIKAVTAQAYGGDDLALLFLSALLTTLA